MTALDASMLLIAAVVLVMFAGTIIYIAWLCRQMGGRR